MARKTKPNETPDPAASQAFSNPFPVYPVSSLNEIEGDILTKTFETDGVRELSSMVKAYLTQLNSNNVPRPTLIAIRGDFGTGKTHLLIYARALLEQGRTTQGRTILSVFGTEADFPSWYVQIVGKRLYEVDLRVVFTDIFAASACDVADRTPLTSSHAAQIRSDPLEVFTILNKGLLSRTDIDRSFMRALEQIAPTSSTLQTVFACMPWATTCDLAMKWISGGALGSAERDLLGVNRDIDPEAEGAATIIAIAAAVRRSGRVFAFFVDEFEHLMAEDRRTGTRRNATWFKRLLEGLSSEASLVCVAGHWRAWEQLPDFGARFATAPIDLVALSAEEVGKLSLKPRARVVGTAHPKCSRFDSRRRKG